MPWKWWNDFNPKMCGKWKSELFEINGYSVIIFLHITQDKDGVHIKNSFNHAYFDSDVLYAEYSGNALYFFHNERAHRAEYLLTLGEAEVLKCDFSVKNCWGMWRTFEKEIAFVPLEAGDKEKYSHLVKPKNESRVDILKAYADYGDRKADVTFEFLFDERGNVADIIGKYSLDDLVKDKPDDKAAIALMNWLCQHYKHGNPPNGLPQTRTPQALMQAADTWEGRTNCRGLSLILAQLLRAYNIKAYHVTGSPYEEPFTDCHVVVNAYSKNLGKWIMLDPTSNLYMRNSDGDIISIAEFRDALVKDEPVTFNDDYFNQHWTVDGYRDYMAKNLIRIERYHVNGYGIDGEGWTVLIPEKYMANEAKRFHEGQQAKFVTCPEYFWQ